jgi:thiol-disulfide isomerase/thioredoxin
MRALRVHLVAALLVVVAHTPVQPADDTQESEARLVWMNSDGSVRWSIPIETNPSGEPSGVLTSGPWHKPLPDLELDLYGGDTVRLGSMTGSVLVLNTWATWCEPCRQELPWLQRLYESNKDRGLVAVAINVGDRPVNAIPFADDLGLSMPIGIYRDEMTPTLFPHSVPSLLVADRLGRVRGRWNGFDPENTPIIEKLVDKLLGEHEDIRTDVARVWVGADRLRIRWRRDMPGLIEDLGIVSDAEGSPLTLVSHGNLLATYDSVGSTVRQWVGDRAAGKLRPAPWATAEKPMVASFRPGAKRIVLLEGPGGDRAVIDIESNVFDLTWLPDGWVGTGRTLGLATMAGLIVIDPDGNVLARPEGFDASCAFATRPAQTGAELTVLEINGRMSRLGAGFERLGRIEAPEHSWTMLAGAAGTTAVAGDDVIAMVRGDLTGDDGFELAVATKSGRLLVAAVLDGTILFDAEWPDIRALAIADLDGDATDELIVGDKSSLAVLERIRPE